MNALADKYGDKVEILGFPCNQFGHQTNENNDEFLNTLKHVRPGGGFEPKATIFEKTDVNGADAAPLLTDPAFAAETLPPEATAVRALGSTGTTRRTRRR